jgi:acylpyruvate hydrolase
VRFANYKSGGKSRVGVVDAAGETITELVGAELMRAGTDFSALAKLKHGDCVAVADVQLLPTVVKPGKVICIGLNYKSHVEETERELPTYPVLFTKFADAIIGPGDDIVAPPESEQIDYEAELAVVIGTAGRRISEADALSHIAGFTVANDITMRDYQYKTHQWLQGKTWPNSTPLGPWLVTGDEIGNGAALDIRLTLNGEVMQQSNTERMIFDIPFTVSKLSEFIAFEPGDVILTGTPSGVGFRRDPKVLLKPGDRVQAEVEGIGTLDNVVVAENVA